MFEEFGYFNIEDAYQKPSKAVRIMTFPGVLYSYPP
jgi:hypothetical protein